MRLFLLCLIIGGAATARADLWSTLFVHDIEVITVTDMTEIGRTYPHATPKEPVYFMIIDLGQQSFGRSWAGEKTPKSREALAWMKSALAKQGYYLADDQHPPTQLFIFAWGMIQGGPGRPALKFLGGEKTSLLRDHQDYGSFINPSLLPSATQRTGVVGQIWDFAEEDLFLGIVRSYTMDTLKGPKITLLWETRFGCPAVGQWLTDALPQMIKAAALNFGRETAIPVSVNASENFKGHVDLGELKIIGTVPEATSGDNNKNLAPEKAESR